MLGCDGKSEIQETTFSPGLQRICFLLYEFRRSALVPKLSGYVQNFRYCKEIMQDQDGTIDFEDCQSFFPVEQHKVLFFLQCLKLYFKDDEGDFEVSVSEFIQVTIE